MGAERIVQSLWVGPEISSVERLSLASFLANGHDVHLYTYGEVGNVPTGVVLREAAEIIPEAEVFTHEERAGEGMGSYAGFANRFRYELLHMKGGWWTDTDVVCLRPWTFEQEYCFGRQDDAMINNAIMKAPKGSALTRLLVETARNPHVGAPWDPLSRRVRRTVGQFLRRRSRTNLHWAQTGPHAITQAIEFLGLAAYALPVACFYPVRHRDWQTVLSDSPGIRERVRDSYAVHLWHEKMRRAGTDKNGSFHPHSLIEEWKAKYLQ